MSDNIKDFPAVTDGAKNATDAPEESGGINVPEEKKKPTQRDAGANAGVYNHKFRKPYEYEGKKYDTLNFNFERLTGRDMIAIENEMQANNEYALDPLLSRNFQSKMAARAGGIGADVLESMPLQEFNKIVTAARNFLIDLGY